MTSQNRSLWALGVPLGILVGLTALLGWQAWKINGGVWIYPLDDTYIHMAIAKNLAFHGTWGVNPGTFSATSSSPLYTLLLALLFKIGGVWIGWPLLINILAAVGVLGVFVQNWMEEAPAPRRSWIAILGMGSVILVPLPVLALSGMEHTLHILAVFFFWIHGLEWVKNPRSPSRWALFWAMLAGGIRYESLFLGAVLCVMLLIQRRVRDTFYLALSVWTVPLLVGVVNLLHGWPFLPTTLLLKGAYWGNVSGWTYLMLVLKQMLHNIARAPDVLVLIGALIWLARWTPSQERWNIMMFAGVSGLHLALAQVGWLFRYESYLIALGVWIMGRVLLSLITTREIVLGVSVGVALLPRIYAMEVLPRAARDIHDIQYQSARFLMSLPPGTPVILGDIGAPAFFSDVHILDLVGLAHKKAARLRTEGREEEIFCTLVREGARVAMVYDSLFPHVRSHAYLIGYWQIPLEQWTIAGWYRMSVYAIHPEDSAFIRERFRAFAKRLPPHIKWKIYQKISPPPHPCL